MFFQGWSGLARVGLVGILAYVVLVVFLRVTGKRTLSKMNAFDLVVTVALGSALATTMLSKTVAYAEGMLALLLLIGLQFAVTWLSVRSERFQSLVKAQPSLLVHRGRWLDAALRRERVTREEVLASLRQQGAASVEDATVVLETDGSLSVISGGDEHAQSLGNVPAAQAGAG